MPLYLALLRGINVGGKNIIRMTALQACFEIAGFRDVTTVIQSGNVILRADTRSALSVTAALEDALSTQFGYQACVVVLPHAMLAKSVHSAPAGFGADPAHFRYDVVFLRSPLTPARALPSIRTRDGVDSAAAGTHVVYFSRLTAKASQSRLASIVGSPIYPSITIRNWNTTTRLLTLMDRIAAGD